jgi:hypothetical protein
MSVAAAFRGMSAVRVPAGRGIPPLADVPATASAVTAGRSGWFGAKTP